MKRERSFMCILFFIFVLLFVPSYVCANVAGLNLKLPFPIGDKWYVTCTYQDKHSDCVTHKTGIKDEWAIDFAIPLNSSVVSVLSGVTSIHPNSTGGYGNYVVVDHGGGYTSQYSHLNSISVVDGENISQWQEIGKAGSTGMSTGPHLHFALYYTDSNGSKWSNKPTPMSSYASFVSGVEYISDNRIYPVGVSEDNIFIQAIYDAFENAGGYNKLGTPFNNGGTKYVHNWNGVIVQDFIHPECKDGCPDPPPTGVDKKYYGEDGQSMIVYNPHIMKAEIISEGFLAVYKEKDGPSLLGPTTSQEFYGLEYIHGFESRQNFLAGYMTYGRSFGIRVYTNSGVLMFTLTGDKYAQAKVLLADGSLSYTLAYNSSSYSDLDYEDDNSPVITAISISGSSSINENSKSQYVVTAYYDDDSSADITNSNNISLTETCKNADINSGGFLTAFYLSYTEVCKIEALYDGEYASLEIVVNNISTNDGLATTNITISGPTSVGVNSKTRYIITAYYSDNSSADITSKVNLTENCNSASIDSDNYFIASIVSIDEKCKIEATYKSRDNYSEYSGISVIIKKDVIAPSPPTNLSIL